MTLLGCVEVPMTSKPQGHYCGNTLVNHYIPLLSNIVTIDKREINIYSLRVRKVL